MGIASRRGRSVPALAPSSTLSLAHTVPALSGMSTSSPSITSSEFVELATTTECTYSSSPIRHTQHNKGVHLHEHNPRQDDEVLPYPRFGKGNPPPEIWVARRRNIMNECTDDLSDVAAFDYYHGRTRETKVSKQHEEADRGLKRRVSFDLGRNVVFEAPKFEELAIPARPIRALGERRSLKLKVR